MTVSCAMNAAPTSPNHGDTVTVTYTVDGNDPISPQTVSITGTVVVGGVSQDVSTSITLPGTPAASVSYEVPVCSGLSFVSTSDPSVFTAVVP